MNYYLVIIFATIIILYLYLQVKSHRRTVNEYQINQLKDPEKDILENVLTEKYPTVITDVVQRWKIVRDLKPENLNFEEKKIMKDPKFIKLLDEYLNYYSIPLRISRKYELNQTNANDNTHIMLNSQFRFYLIQIYGKSRVILYNNSNTKYLYPTKKGNVSKINYWKLDNIDTKLNNLYYEKENKTNETNTNLIKELQESKNKYLEKFPKYNKAKFIEIILHPGNILYIPYGWWFSTKSETDSIRLTNTSRSLFSW